MKRVGENYYIIRLRTNKQPPAKKTGGLDSLMTESRDTGQIALLAMFTLTL